MEGQVDRGRGPQFFVGAWVDRDLLEVQGGLDLAIGKDHATASLPCTTSFRKASNPTHIRFAPESASTGNSIRTRRPRRSISTIPMGRYVRSPSRLIIPSVTWTNWLRPSISLTRAVTLPGSHFGHEFSPSGEISKT
jgi:hypothetical protein